MYYANQKGQILALDFERMNLFRNTNLHKIIEVSKNWEYRQPMVRNARRAITRKAGVHFDVDDDEGEPETNKNFKLKKRGTINFLKNVIKHRVNIVNQHETEYEDYFSEEGSDDSEGTRMRKRLRRQLAMERRKNQRGVKVNAGGGASDDSHDLDRDDGDDWNNFRTGGEVQLEKATLANKRGQTIKPLKQRQDVIE